MPQGAVKEYSDTKKEEEFGYLVYIPPFEVEPISEAEAITAMKRRS